MDVLSITVTQLKFACLDPEWRESWLAGENPSTRHLTAPGAQPSGGSLFHGIVERFTGWLVEDRAATGVADEVALWQELYRRFGEPKLDALMAKGQVERAVYLSSALQAFCRNISGMRLSMRNFSGWRDLFLGQEHAVKDVPFNFGTRTVFVSGILDGLRLHPKHGIQIVDYKLSRGANLKHDLVQLAIYAGLLARAEPGLEFHAALEYYLPELEVIEVPAEDLTGIFDDLVLPVLTEIATDRRQPLAAAKPPPKHEPNVQDDDDTADKITSCFGSFGLPVVMTGRQEGPQLVRYTLQPASGVKVVSLANRAEDLQVALKLAQAPRIEPAAAGVTVDIPRQKPETVLWRDVMDQFKGGPLAFPVGVAVDGSVLTADLSDSSMCHALVAGASGSGKSEWLKSVVASLMHRSTPESLRLALTDPKLLTFTSLEKSPHLLRPLMTDIQASLDFLEDAVAEMDRRYSILAKERFSNLRERRDAGKTDLPFWIILFDEFADLILAGRDEKKQFESAVSRLAGKGRAAGIHLILATQRPDNKIVTGLIKANLPVKVCLRVTNAINSQIVLDEPGAEKLLGRGDLLCDLGRGVQRAQGLFVSSDELEELARRGRRNGRDRS
ncbi:DNA translocase FtsK [Prosthecobacter sp.]|uniref:DNA translocase FtsK n=1 Tax=Prosthecobacter sp. TaxID=1965333 RepID=UPI0037847C51